MQLLSTIQFFSKFTRIKSVKRTFYLYSSLNIVSKGTSVIMPSSSNIVLRRIDNIIKSAEDKRAYRGLELSNRMKVLLISDPTTDKSSAAMDVNIGYLTDPDYLPGLAHFCEHMLFLGTEKFPNENAYTKFLSEHGGSSNAATYQDHTAYYFDVSTDQLSNALDRFSQFFLKPLFTESATERELSAIHSEHEKNISIDGWRIDQMEKHNANPNHPYHKFGTGNKETLQVIPKEKGINIRDELLKFHNTWYSSNIMALAVLGKESLDELEEMVIEYFAGIEDKGVEVPIWEEHPFSDEQMRTCTYIVPVKDIRSLNIVFPSPDITNLYKCAPEKYVTNLIGHEGPGSLLSALKERGWCNSLVAGNKQAPRGFSFFGISVDLTEEGMDHIDDIVKLIFQYINMVKSTPPLEWFQNECKDIDSIAFRFKDKESPRSYSYSVVHHIHEYPFEDVLSAPYLSSEWNPTEITKLLDNFVPEKVRLGVIAKKFADITDQKEPWYGVQYKLVQIPEATLSDWKNAGVNSELRIPDVNDFIPTDFELYPLAEEVTEHPQIIQDTAITRVWFKQDDKFLLPKANLMFDFVSPLAYLDPLNCNLTHMLVSLFRDSLNQYAYAAELAGLKWSLSNTKYGLILSIGGFNNKQDKFLDKIMDKLTNFEIDPKRFDIYKENYIRILKNFSAEQPYQHAVYHLAVLLTEHSWTKDELLSATEQLTVERLEAFIPQILSKMHIECLLYGNLNKEKALELVDIVENRLTSRINLTPLLPRQLLLNRELKLENGCNYLYEVNNNIHKSSCIELYYQCGLQNKEMNILLELFAQIIQEPFFNTLRTKEQLGYIVFSGVRRSNGCQGLRVIVQSEKHPTYLDGRIETFLTNIYEIIKNMSEEEFERHKEALAVQRLEKPKQLSVLSFRFWSEITSQQYHFDRANVEVAYLKTVTKDDILQFYKENLEENAENRHKIAIHVVSLADGGAGHKKEEIETPTSNAPNPIPDVTVFKSSHGMYPLVQPYINISRKGNKCKL